MYLRATWIGLLDNDKILIFYISYIIKLPFVCVFNLVYMLLGENDIVMLDDFLKANRTKSNRMTFMLKTEPKHTTNIHSLNLCRNYKYILNILFGLKYKQQFLFKSLNTFF